MSGSDPEGVVRFKAGGKSYAAYCGFRAQKAAEAYYDAPYFEVLQRVMPGLTVEDTKDRAKLEAAAKKIKFTDIGNFFEFQLLQHHRDITEDEVIDLVDELGLARVGEIIGEALAATMAEEAEQDSVANPPRRAAKGSRKR